MPSIAAQPHQFIVTQLVMFREERRKDPLMSPVAAKMTNAEINELADYFSKQTLPPPREANAQVVANGKNITEQFYCVSCHGATLGGQLHVPRLAGQQRQYLVTQLRGFKAGTRFDMDGNMTAAMQGVAEADLELIADYLSSLK
jgi:cytochrome c553